MGDYVTVQVKGLRELGETLRTLPTNVAKNTGRGATAAAAATIRDEARARARDYVGRVAAGHPPPGTLRRAIVTKQIPEKSGPLKQTFFVTVRSGKQYQKQGKHGTLSQDAYYAAFVEFGTEKMCAHPFMRPAFDAKKNAAVAALETYLAKRLPREVEKLSAFGLRLR